MSIVLACLTVQYEVVSHGIEAAGCLVCTYTLLCKSSGLRSSPAPCVQQEATHASMPQKSVACVTRQLTTMLPQQGHGTERWWI